MIFFFFFFSGLYINFLSKSNCLGYPIIKLYGGKVPTLQDACILKILCFYKHNEIHDKMFDYDDICNIVKLRRVLNEQVWDRFFTIRYCILLRKQRDNMLEQLLSVYNEDDNITEQMYDIDGVKTHSLAQQFYLEAQTIYEQKRTQSQIILTVKEKLYDAIHKKYSNDSEIYYYELTRSIYKIKKHKNQIQELESNYIIVPLFLRDFWRSRLRVYYKSYKDKSKRVIFLDCEDEFTFADNKCIHCGHLTYDKEVPLTHSRKGSGFVLDNRPKIWYGILCEKNSFYDKIGFEFTSERDRKILFEKANNIYFCDLCLSELTLEGYFCPMKWETMEIIPLNNIKYFYEKVLKPKFNLIKDSVSEVELQYEKGSGKVPPFFKPTIDCYEKYKELLIKESLHLIKDIPEEKPFVQPQEYFQSATFTNLEHTEKKLTRKKRQQNEFEEEGSEWMNPIKKLKFCDSKTIIDNSIEKNQDTDYSSNDGESSI